MSAKSLLGRSLVTALGGLLIAAPALAATLSLSPSSKSLNVGDTLTVNVVLDSQGQGVDGVDLNHINYNPALLQLQDADSNTSGTQITPGTLMPVTVYNSADTSAGKISFSQLSNPGSDYTGSGNVASMTFKALAAGTANVILDFTYGSTTDSNVASAGTDLLTAVTNGQYTISGGTTPPPSPSPTPTPTPSPTPSPTPTPTPSPTPTPTPTPSPTPTPTPSPANANVVMTGTAFAPKVLNVTTGTTVVWQNNDSVAHTVTADGGSFNSGSLAMGATFSHTFSAAGTYAYYCTFHGGPGGTGMSGTVVVTDASSSLNYPATPPPATSSSGSGVKLINNNGTFYLEQNGELHGITNPGMLKTYGFTFAQAQAASGGDLALPQGPLLPPGNGSLVKSQQDPTVYLISGQMRFPFTSAKVFTDLGFKFSSVLLVTDPELQALPKMNELSDSSAAHLPGTDITDHGTIYWMSPAGTRDPYPSADVYNSWRVPNDFSSVVAANSADLALPVGNPVVPRPEQ